MELLHLHCGETENECEIYASDLHAVLAMLSCPYRPHVLETLVMRTEISGF